MADGTATADGGITLPDVEVTAPRVVPTAPPRSPGAPPTAAGPKPGRDELVLTADGQPIAGWQAIRVQRSCEVFPSAFDIGLTEKYPAVPVDVPIAPGQVCTVRIGDDLVITGYLDRYMPRIAASNHTVRVVGRGAGCDLRDCTVIWDSMQVSGTSVRDLAEKLAAPYGVAVLAPDGDGPPIPQININLGETPYEVIERCARWAGFLVYEDAEGRVVLARVGTNRHSSGLKQGVNVQDGGASFALDERYSEYHGYVLAASPYGEALNPADPQGGNEKAVVLDPGMQNLKRPDGQKRVRKLAVIGEQMIEGRSLLELRVKWEMTRRLGRSKAVRVECDSWRDSAGRLWEPNWRVKMDLPALKLADTEMVIAEVTYLRDGRGTRADLLLMPPEAFAIEPTPLFNNTFGALLQQDKDAPAGTGPTARSNDAGLGGLPGNVA